MPMSGGTAVQWKIPGAISFGVPILRVPRGKGSAWRAHPIVTVVAERPSQVMDVAVPDGTASQAVAADLHGLDTRIWPQSVLDEREQVGVDRVRLRGGHAVRKALVGLQLPVLQ